MARHSNLVAGYAFSAWLREREAQQMMRSLPSLTCERIAPRPAVDASVYSRNGKLKSGKAVIGQVVRRVLRRSKASWQSGPQWKTSSFLISEVLNITPVISCETQKRADFRGILGGLIPLMAASREVSGRRPSSVTRWPR